MTRQQAAAERIRKFIDEYKKMRGLHPEMVYEIHGGDDHRQAAITIADLEALLAQPEPEGPPMPVPGDAEGLAEVFWGRYDQSEPEGATDEELEDFALQNGGGYFNCDCQEEADMLTRKHVSNYRAVLARWGRPAIEPVPVSGRFEFSVFDSEYEEQAGGTAPTYSQALSEGQHYLAMYSQDGPHSLGIRRVEVLPPPRPATTPATLLEISTNGRNIH